jgi:hypothetical protein
MKLANLAVLASSIAFIAATPALAAPVYLVCSFMSPYIAEEEDYTLNEQAGTITYTGPNATYTPTFRAAFTPDRVVYRNQMLSTYTFNRIDLSVTVTNSSGPANLIRGQCKLRTAPAKRAF